MEKPHTRNLFPPILNSLRFAVHGQPEINPSWMENVGWAGWEEEEEESYDLLMISFAQHNPVAMDDDDDDELGFRWGYLANDCNQVLFEFDECSKRMQDDDGDITRVIWSISLFLTGNGSPLYN